MFGGCPSAKRTALLSAACFVSGALAKATRSPQSSSPLSQTSSNSSSCWACEIGKSITDTSGVICRSPATEPGECPSAMELGRFSPLIDRSRAGSRLSPRLSSRSRLNKAPEQDMDILGGGVQSASSRKRGDNVLAGLSQTFNSPKLFRSGFFLLRGGLRASNVPPGPACTSCSCSSVSIDGGGVQHGLNTEFTCSRKLSASFWKMTRRTGVASSPSRGPKAPRPHVPEGGVNGAGGDVMRWLAAGASVNGVCGAFARMGLGVSASGVVGGDNVERERKGSRGDGALEVFTGLMPVSSSGTSHVRS